MAKGLRPVRDDPAVEARYRQVLALVIGGWSFSEIAERLGYNDRAAAHKAYKAALERVIPVENIEEWREVHTARFERLIRGVWPMAIGRAATDDSPAVHPDLEAVDSVRRLLLAQGRVLGMGSHIEISGPRGGPVEVVHTYKERRQIVEAALADRREKLIGIGYTPAS